MEIKSFLVKNILLCYFLVVAGVTGAIGILGVLYMPEKPIGYEAFFSPFIFGLIAIIPSFAVYSRKELSVKQMLFRYILHFILLETAVMLFAFFAGLLTSPDIALSLFLSVMLISLTVRLILWLNGRRIAAELNQALKKLQNS